MGDNTNNVTLILHSVFLHKIIFTIKKGKMSLCGEMIKSIYL